MAATLENTDAPRWDPTRIFPGLESSEFRAAVVSLDEKIATLGALFDKHQVKSGGSVEITDDPVSAFDGLLRLLNDTREEHRTIRSYIRAFVTTDTRDVLARAKQSEVDLVTTDLEKLSNRFELWVGSMDVAKLCERSELAADHVFALRRLQKTARYRMSQEEEDLYAELHVTGAGAWEKLHGQIASQLSVKVTMPDGEVEYLPMSKVSRGLARHPDENVRRVAFEAEIDAWQSAAEPLAAALNGIKGETNVVTDRRGWKDPLEASLFENNVDRETFDAMQAACVESFPEFRGYLKTKAKLLGKQTLAWWDINAPVGGHQGQKQWSFTEAKDFVIEHFASYSDELSAFAKRAFDNQWIDAESRVGKVDGAFCMGVKGEESLILTNYEPSFHIVHSLAHELGHAYHNLNLARRTPLNRNTPMGLAETASTFCQTITTNAALRRATSENAKLALLEKDLQEASQSIVDIHSRFLFEKRVFEQRRKRELSVEEFNGLMLEAQKEVYGDALDHARLHPYMWAVKPHYYMSSSYYNWPYAFGLLFGLGLYARYVEDPDGFRKGYDDLLSSTGLADAAELSQRFGLDIRSSDFWRSSIQVIRDRIAEFVKLAA